MPLHDFILPKSDTNSTVFDFLVIFCSFYVYSLVPGVWHFFISGLYLISTIRPESKRRAFQSKVSMPSRAYTSFLLCQYVDGSIEAFVMCQCPLGLIPHFYVAACTRRRTDEEVCQCPLGLIPHFYDKDVLLMARWYCVNALSGLYLISTVPLQKPRFYAVSRACFCRYLSEYSDNSSFACMLTFWTYLMRCTYPWHWIKYSTNYNRCHPIFSLSW